jgi:Lysozyme like domain
MSFPTPRHLNLPRRRLVVAASSLFALTLALASPAAAASLSPMGAAAASGSESTAVKVCGQGPAVTRPSSTILTCADDGMIAKHLRWSSWTGTRATATGIVTWRACSAKCADSKGWDSATADVTLTDPVRESGREVLFTRLDLHVTGRTPARFIRNAVFSEAPIPKVNVPPQVNAPAAPRGRPATALPRQSSAAPSGTLGYAQIEGFWIDAGGPSGSDGSYTYAQVAAAITGAESSFQPGIIQPDQPYSTTGWGLWQITPGNSVSQYGTDFQILDPWNNAEAAVNKYDGAGGFSPWTTFVDGAYTNFLQHTAAHTGLTDPGEYVQINSAPSGTPSSPAADPGSTDGPAMAAAYAFWSGTGSSADLEEAQGAAVSSLSGPFNRGMGPLGSAPAVGVDGNGHTYVYWKGTDGDLWEGYWNGSDWVGPFNRGMGTLGSQPSVAVTQSGTAFVFWKGTNGDLYEAQGPADGALSGPFDRGMGPLGSAPAAGVDGNGHTYVYWEGSDGDLWEGYWNGSGWVGPFDRGMGPLGSQPSVAMTPSATAYVFWKGTNGDLYQAQGPADGALSGPTSLGMGPLGSAPAAGVDGFGDTFVYWEGTSPSDALWEAYWNGSGWVGPFDRGQGPLNSAPTVAIYSYTTG